MAAVVEAFLKKNCVKNKINKNKKQNHVRIRRNKRIQQFRRIAWN